MKKVAIIGDGSIGNVIKAIASNIQGSTTTMFKDVESGELSTEMPTNKIFEITNILRNEEIKSGRENRRERRKNKRKNK